VCLVVASEMTVRTFLYKYVAAMQSEYDLTVVVNTTNLFLLEDLGLAAQLLPVAIERGISIRKDIAALVRITRLLRRGRFDMVHSITPKAGLLAMVGGLLARTPVRLHTFSGQVWATRAGLSRALLKNLDRLLAASATFTIADSSSQRDFLVQERVVAASKSTVLGNGSLGGVDCVKFHPDVDARCRIRRELGIPSEDMVLLFVGRLNRDKGVLDLAQAFARIAQVRNNVRLLVVGIDEQEMRPAMRSAIEPHTERLHFVDFTGEPEAFMAASDVLCLPSYREGFPTVIVEAAAVGLPSVASRIYGVIDTMEEGRTGLSHAPRDTNAIAETLLQILSDSDLRRRLGEAARERALRDFSQATVTKAVMELYERLLRHVSSHQTQDRRQSICKRKWVD
jgi:glycosyltransferase involved in cell wall biosynthesis